MKHFKDLNACIVLLQAIHRRNDIEPRMRKRIKAAIDLCREFRRLDHPSRPQTFRYMRNITENLVAAFIE